MGFHCAIPRAVSLSRGFPVLTLCAVVIGASQAVISHGFVTPNSVRFNYRYGGGHCANAELQGNQCSSSAAQRAAAAARSSATAAHSAAAAAAGMPPHAYIRGVAVAAGRAGRTPSHTPRGEGGVGLVLLDAQETGNLSNSALYSGASAASLSPAELELLEQVKDVVAEQLKVDRVKVELESNFIKDLNADSLDSVELVMAFEEKFGVTIPDEEATKITTVKDALTYIQQAKQKNDGSGSSSSDEGSATPQA